MFSFQKQNGKICFSCLLGRNKHTQTLRYPHFAFQHSLGKRVLENGTQSKMNDGFHWNSLKIASEKGNFANARFKKTPPSFSYPSSLWNPYLGKSPPPGQLLVGPQACPRRACPRSHQQCQPRGSQPNLRVPASQGGVRTKSQDSVPGGNTRL